MWAHRVEAQKALLDNIRDMKEFNLVSRDRQTQGHNRQQRDNMKEEICRKFQILWYWAPARQCPVYGKKCSRCGKMNHFKAV